MNRIDIEYKYKLGQFIYHNTPESDKGIITDITYSILTRLVRYTVVFGRGSDDEVLCYEHELSETKTF